MLNLVSDVFELVLWGLDSAIFPRLISEATLSPLTIVMGFAAVMLFILVYMLFDLATWLFAYNYYNCQAKLLYVKDSKTLPADFERN